MSIILAVRRWPDLVLKIRSKGRIAACKYGAVVDKDRAGGDLDVEVVVIGDGEVPHPAVPVPGSMAPHDHCRGAARRAQTSTVAERGGLGPLPGGRIPEQVGAGGVDDPCAVRGFDGQIVAVGVVVDEDSCNRLGSSLAGLHVGGEDLVAGFVAGGGRG